MRVRCHTCTQTMSASSESNHARTLPWWYFANDAVGPSPFTFHETIRIATTDSSCPSPWETLFAKQSTPEHTRAQHSTTQHNTT